MFGQILHSAHLFFWSLIFNAFVDAFEKFDYLAKWKMFMAEKYIFN